MPFELRGTVTPVPRGATRYEIAKYDTIRGTLAVPPFIHPFNDNKGLALCAKKMGVNQLVIANFLIELRKQGVTNAVLPLDTVGPDVTIYVRQSADRIPHPDFPTALASGLALVADCKGNADCSEEEAKQYAAENTFIEWSDTEQLCVLDVDFHGINAGPLRHKLEAFCDSVQPAPSHWWVSKRGGLHLVYGVNAVFNADEIAAVAAYQAIEKFPTCKIEFLKHTRLPPYGEAVKTRTVSNDMDAVRILLSQTPVYREYKEFREKMGWAETGLRLKHTECPIDPNNRDGDGANTSVTVMDGGLQCHRCAGMGICYGSRKPGFVPYAVLAGEVRRSEVARCVEKWTHWTHAQHIVRQTIQQENVAKKVYGALLKLQHGPDPRAALCFTCDSTKPFVRGNGYWMTELGERMPMSKDSAILAALPGVMIVDADGDPKPMRKDVEVFAMTNDMTKIGYLPITPVPGIQLSAMQVLPPNKVYAVLPPKYTQYEGEQWREPKYVSGVDDAKLDEAFGVLESVVPNIDRNLILLLLIGRGCVEHRSGIPPMLFLSGVTSAGKTGHCEIAASILGDNATTTHYTANVERLKQSVMEGKMKGGFVLFDEFMKNARMAGKTVEDAFLISLLFDSKSTSHVLYVGQVALGDLPFFIWVDTDYPDAIAGNEQVGRRLHYKRMHNKVYWQQPLKNAGIEKPEKLREQGSKELIGAMNQILSYVMDRWFSSAATNFEDAAAELGVILLSEYGGVADKNAIIRELFASVCAAPDITDAKTRKYITARGMKLAQAGADCALYDACDALFVDEERQGNKLPIGIRAMNESDVGRLIGADCPVRFEIKALSWQRFGVRFTSMVDGDNRVNQELIAKCKKQTSQCTTKSGENLPIRQEESIDMSLPFLLTLT
jgi:hypothetical protein